ncbi:MAG: hypothetical protein ACE5H5_02850 [Nitrospinota bacterium]
MSELIHTTRVRIEQLKPPLRHAFIEHFEEAVPYGVHGRIKDFYGLEPDEEVPATLDHIVAAVAG